MQRMALTLSTLTENNDILDLGTSNFCLLELSHYETQCKKKLECYLKSENPFTNSPEEEGAGTRRSGGWRSG